jgi:ribose 5-phosphate isomerase B
VNERLVAEIVRRVLDEVDRRGPGEAGPAGAAPAAGRGRSVATTPASWPPTRVALGSDHGGYEMKEDLARFLRAKGFAVEDCGTHGPESCDYPDFARAVATRVSDGRCQAGIVIDGAGIGSGMAANKVPGVRCAVCHDVATIRNSREHNDANMLSLGAGVVPMALARRMVHVWLTTEHGGGRHLKRVRKIMEIES